MELFLNERGELDVAELFSIERCRLDEAELLVIERGKLDEAEPLSTLRGKLDVAELHNSVSVGTALESDHTSESLEPMVVWHIQRSISTEQRYRRQ